ncbi:MAG: radical SAM protein [Cyanobacteria bacterium REEB446]|nr:radical SAM protein [Cyanobacteria bacterium REEB446]
MDFDLIIYLTNKCNLFCDHCDQSSGNAKENELSTAEIITALEALLRCEKFEHAQFELHSEIEDCEQSLSSIKHICLSGGEPVQYKDFFHIAKIIIDKGLDLSFITNATFSPSYYSRIRELNFKGIYVSLDGLETTHNLLRRSGLSYKRVIQFLEFLVNLNTNLYMVTCVTSTSIYELDALFNEIYGSANKYKIKKWFLMPMQMKGRALDHLDLQLDTLHIEALNNFIEGKRNFAVLSTS